METFLVEHYRPGADQRALRRAIRALRAAAVEMSGEGRAIRHLRSAIVPDDEGFLSFFEAASEELVRDAHDRARVKYERISRALSTDDDQDEPKEESCAEPH